MSHDEYISCGFIATSAFVMPDHKKVYSNKNHNSKEAGGGTKKEGDEAERKVSVR